MGVCVCQKYWYILLYGLKQFFSRGTPRGRKWGWSMSQTFLNATAGASIFILFFVKQSAITFSWWRSCMCYVYCKNEAFYAYDYLMASLSEARPRPGPNYLKADVFSLRLSSGIFCGVFSSSKNLETNRSHKIQFIKILSVGERQITLSGHNTAFLLEWFGLSHHHLCLSPCGSLTLACSHLQQTSCSKGNFVLWKLWRLCFILYYGSSNILCLPFCHSESKEDITAVILLAFIVTIVNVTSLFPSYLTYLALN